MSDAEFIGSRASSVEALIQVSQQNKTVLGAFLALQQDQLQLILSCVGWLINEILFSLVALFT